MTTTETIVFTFEAVRYFHDRPESSDRYSVEAADLDEAIGHAVMAESLTLDTLDAAAVEASRVEISLLEADDVETGFVPLIYWNGEEWTQAECCEVCDDYTFGSDYCGAFVCTEHATEWDSDYARSYGPGAEVQRLRRIHRS